MQSSNSIPAPARLLGLSGLLPQLLCLGTALLDPVPPDTSGFAALGLVYAALILSFLGGLWWMAALLQGLSQTWPYLVAVVPSLLGWIALWPLAIGFDGIGTSLVLVGLLLLATPLVDRHLAKRITLPEGWIRLRVIMATGLGTLTLSLGLI
ncbi:hypothetical protein CHU95_12405 [Niveispirillum lacus]|uniref:DUF3429 domain-containing protein n=1 Tax=Niveispirillum lacus TaxID=1981099 RepID=A0A255YYC1_9PROT|nr:DUF3429 domain-containing protein [Niveispirillum lacus]OYQ34243.1 hypothetical protein CHU95_12405 [Niveispirillum lacus]